MNALTYWGMVRDPFPPYMSEHIYYPAGGHANGIARLVDALHCWSGISLLLGETGYGKTTLLHELRDALGHTAGICAATVTHTEICLPDLQFLRAILSQFGKNTDGRSGVACRAEFQKFLDVATMRQQRVVLCIDDAHMLTSAQIDLVRTLAMDAQISGNLHIVLFGRVVLRDKIARRPQLAQQMRITHLLNPLSPVETCAFIAHRIAWAGISDWESCVTQDACDAIYRTTCGIPAAIVAIARASFIEAQFAGVRRVSAAIVDASRNETAARYVA